MDNNSITKSNALIEAGYRLSLTEMQIVLYGISLINPIAKDFPLKYRIDIKHFSELFNRNHGDIYREVKNAILSKFWERDFSYKDETGKIITNRWLTQIKHQDNTGYLEIKFNEEVQPYLHQLKKYFTTYYIDQIALFKSIYSVRLYEMSVMHLKKSKKEKCIFVLEIKEIRNRLELGNKYKRFHDIKIRILETAKREINKYSDIRFSYKIVKLGKAANEVEFFTSKKTRSQPDLLNSPQSEYKPAKLSPTVFEKAKQMALAAGTGWDIYAMEQQFYTFIKKKGAPESYEGAFLGFVKKKVAKPP